MANSNRQARVPKDIMIRPSYEGELRKRREEVASIYIEAFEGYPWYEKFLVRLDGKWTRIGSPEELRELDRLVSDGILCKDDIKPFYTAQSVMKSIETTSSCMGFAVAIATDLTRADATVGISWGMPAQAIPDVEKRESVQLIISKNNLNPEKVFYLDETFVQARYQGMGIGGGLVRTRGNMALEMGCTYAIVRTLNPIQVNNLSSAYGRDNITEVYSNPGDEIQPDRKYYLIAIKRVRD